MERAVRVPAGLQPGTELRLTGEGNHGPRGGAPGDLYISVDVKPHPILERDGESIVSNVVINVAEAALGASLEVETADGPTSVKIPSGIQAGTPIRLRGKGAPRLRGSGRGDHFLFVHVATPSKLSRKQRDLLEQLRETLPAAAIRAGAALLRKSEPPFGE